MFGRNAVLGLRTGVPIYSWDLVQGYSGLLVALASFILINYRNNTLPVSASDNLLQYLNVTYDVHREDSWHKYLTEYLSFKSAQALIGAALHQNILQEQQHTPLELDKLMRKYSAEFKFMTMLYHGAQGEEVTDLTNEQVRNEVNALNFDFNCNEQKQMCMVWGSSRDARAYLETTQKWLGKEELTNLDDERKLIVAATNGMNQFDNSNALPRNFRRMFMN